MTMLLSTIPRGRQTGDQKKNRNGDLPAPVRALDASLGGLDQTTGSESRAGDALGPTLVCCREGRTRKIK